MKKMFTAPIIICLAVSTCINFSSAHPELIASDQDPHVPFDYLAVFVGYKYNKTLDSGVTIPTWSIQPNLPNFDYEYLFEVIAPSQYKGALFVGHYDGYNATGIHQFDFFKPDVIYRFNPHHISIYDFSFTYCVNTEREVNSIEEVYEVELLSLRYIKKKLTAELTSEEMKIELMKSNSEEDSSDQFNYVSNSIDYLKKEIRCLDVKIKEIETKLNNGIHSVPEKAANIDK